MSNQKKGNPKPESELPPIPQKLYFTIGEVGKLCELRTHVLRYWEQEFSPLSPLKRRGNRRYYQLKDVLLVRKIRRLLYEEGYTIEGAKQKLSEDTSHDKREYKAYETIRRAISELERIAAGLEMD
ncbi:transcriptional regulator [Coxiella-like endosymbiont of Rhipicephalus sanguineus]|uniref:MerR family transcriptional regulator n=1 Tax=Coxiella-like endosymbiont of Rhipicephalus sanguineus TaxID=1955402 RepID=UPI00203E7A57|nr:MerR family transcriptional regulator [Coxiella-like endosymbiont of Rhipicephalus sanguineus]MBT8506453.1 transcriptional regulator [Coxiella-like endosymbiont of Rhipicephalus sanguineus]